MASICSSQSAMHTASEIGKAAGSQHYNTSLTLQHIVASASQLAASGALSVSRAGIIRPAAFQQALANLQPISVQPHSAAGLPQLAMSNTASPLLLDTQASAPCSPQVPTWQNEWHAAAGLGAAQQQLQPKVLTGSRDASRPSARRCLCLSLVPQDPMPTASTGPDPPYTPVLNSVAADAGTGAKAAAAAAPDSCSSCTHDSSSSNRSRLQAWLDKMELQLHVPATPLVPPIEPCPAPRHNTSSGAAEGFGESRKRALAAVGALSLASPGAAAAEECERSSKRRSSFDGTGAAAGDAQQQQQQQQGRSDTSTAPSVAADPAAEIVAAVSFAPPGSGCEQQPGAWHEQQQQRLDGDGAAATAGHRSRSSSAACLSPPWGKPATCLGARLPAPAFVILGVISGGSSE